MSGWPPWRTADRWGLAGYASTRAEELPLPRIERRQPVDGPSGRRAVAEALYDVLRAQAIEYDLEKFDPSDVHQQVRTPWEVLVSPRKGTCLDLALLFSGLALANELLPVVVVLDGHALVLLATTHGRRQWEAGHRPGGDDFLREPVTDPDRILELVESGAFLPVECTGFAHVHQDRTGVLGGPDRVDGHLSFDAAVAHGTRLLRERRPALLFAVDVQVAHAKGFGELDFAPWPAGPLPADVDEHVVPHERALRELDVRRRYLRNDMLRFLTPGEDHPTAPANLLRRLADGEAGHGVVLVGPAGAGKTRTCREVAALADADGWRVLHVQHSTEVTASHIREAVLREPGARTLLVLDYLDVCTNVEIDELESLVVRPVERAGGRIAMIATSRPGRLAPLRGRGIDALFESCHLRGDPEFLELVIGHIFEEVAQHALDKLGPRLSEVCGNRPVIALLIARDVERLVCAGEHVRTGPRAHALLQWLRDRLSRDGLLPDPRAGQDADGEWTVLASAFTAALTPGPRVEVEHLVQRLFDQGDEDRSARELIDELTEMGWLELVGDTLDVAHDVVTDELLVAAVAPVDGLRVLDARLHTLLDVLVDAPGALDRFAGNVARVHAELKGGKPEKLDRACRDWVRDYGLALGTSLARSPEGGHALYTLLHAAPWQKAVSDNWNEVVEPWLAREFGGRDRVEVLAYSLREFPTGQAGPVVTRALVWLAGHAEHASADLVLTYLLRRDDLDQATAAVAARHALSWLKTAPPGSDPTFALRGLLQIELDDPELRARVLDVAVRWAMAPPLPPVADFVLRPLIRRATPGTRNAVVTAALGWLDDHGLERRASFVLRSLLTRDDLTPAEIVDVGNRSLDWLAGHGSLFNATHVLQPLLADREGRYATLDRAPEAVAHARRWLRLRPMSDAASYLLPGLLVSPHVTDDEAAEDLTLVSAWLDAHADGQLDTSFVLRTLVYRVTASNVGEELTRDGIRRACAWLGATAPNPDQRYVLVPLLRRIRTCDQETADTVVGMTRQWLRAHPAHEATSHVLTAALNSSRFPAEAWNELLDAAIGWIRRHSADPKGVYVLRTLLNGMRLRRVDPERSRLIAVQAQRWLRKSGTLPEQGSVLALLLTSDALRPQHRVPVLRASLDWLDKHLDDPAAADVLSAVFALRASAGAAEHDEDGDEAPRWEQQPVPVDEAEAEVHRAIDAQARRWLRVQRDETATGAVLRTMLVAAVDADPAGAGQVVHAAFLWLARNADNPGANDLFQSLLELGDRLDVRVLDTLPREPSAVPVLAALVHGHGRDLDAVHHALAVAVRWLNAHPAEPVAFFVRQAVLRSRAFDPHQLSPVVTSTLDWLAAVPTHPWASWALRAVLGARRLEKDQLCLAAEAAFAWLDAVPDHVAVNNVLQSLLRNTLTADHLARAVDLTNRWLDAFPDHPSSSFVHQDLLRARGLDRDQLSDAADRAAAFVDATFEDRTAAYMLHALLSVPTLHHDRLVWAVDRALAWVERHPDDPAASRVLHAVLTVRASIGRTSTAVDAVLRWMEGNERHPGFNYLLKVVLKMTDLGAARQQRAAQVAFAGLAADPNGPTSAYVLQALLGAKHLPLPLLEASADAALAWVARNGDQVPAPFVLRLLVMKRRLPDAHRARAFEQALAWMDRHFDDNDVRAPLSGLLTARQANATDQRRAVEWALHWLDRYRGHLRANYVLQDLLQGRVEEPDHRDQVFRETLAWLGLFPDVVATPFLLRKALTSRHIDLTHVTPLVRIALKWLERNPRYAEADNVLQGLLDCAPLADPDLSALAVEVVDTVFDWLRANGDAYERGYVIVALCRCPWLSEADRERAVDEAWAAAARPGELAERHQIVVDLVNRADRLSPQRQAALIPFALGQVDRLSVSDRATVYGRLAARDDAVVQVLDWLDTDEASCRRTALLPGLLARPFEAPETRRRAVDVALRTVTEDPAAGEVVIVALPSVADLTVEQERIVSAWLDETLPDTRSPSVLTALLRRTDLPAGWRDSVRRAAVDLICDITDQRDHTALVADVTADPACTDDDIDRLVLALRGRPAFAALVVAVVSRSHVAQRHRAEVERAVADARARDDRGFLGGARDAASGRHDWAALRLDEDPAEEVASGSAPGWWHRVTARWKGRPR